MQSLEAIALFFVLVSAVLAVIVSVLAGIVTRRATADPEVRPEDPDTVITLVHGTWARRARWTRPDSRLCCTLRKGLQRVLLERFVWSGGNAITSREKAAQSLTKHLRGLLSRYPGAQHYVIAHSHGGNIAMYALREDDLREHIGLVCLSTPFLHVKPRLVPRVSRFALTGAAIMLPMFIREAAERQLWPNGPAMLDWLSGLVALALGIGLVIVLPRAARRASERLTLSGVSPSRCLLIRVAGDEASAALGSLQLINWLTTVLWVKPAELVQAAYDRLMMLSRALERFDRPALWILLASITWALAGIAAGHSRNLVVMGPALLGGAGVFAYSLVRWSRHDFLMYGFIVLGIAFAPLPILLGLLLLPFGPGLAPLAVLLDVSAEPTPPGVWTVCQLPTQQPDDPIPMMHSASYQLPEAIDLVLSWLRGRTQVTRV